MLITLCAPCKTAPTVEDWEDKPSASSHREQEKSHAALRLQEITLLLMTQGLMGTLCTLSARAVGLCNMLQTKRSHTVCPTVHQNYTIKKDNYSISPMSVPSFSFTRLHTNQMKRRKPVKLSLDDKPLQRDLPPATCPAVCLIRTENLWAVESAAAHGKKGDLAVSAHSLGCLVRTQW